jgi:hypothetical protein
MSVTMQHPPVNEKVSVLDYSPARNGVKQKLCPIAFACELTPG